MILPRPRNPKHACRLVACRIALALLISAAWSIPAAASEAAANDSREDPDAPELRATGMTFIGSRGATSELVLRSETATLGPNRDFAHLEVVHAVVTEDDAADSFEMTCDRADLNVDTNDFRAEGRVRGTTADGQEYAAAWVEYDHEAGLLYTSAPVVMVDKTGTFRGDGFRYHVRERKFQLLGNVSVEQNP